MQLDPHWRPRLEAQVHQQLPAERDLERGRYSADDFLRYDLTDQLLDYLVAAFDVLEIIEIGHRRLRVDNAVTVESFDLVARSDRQLAFAKEPDSDRGLTTELPFGSRGRVVFVKPEDAEKVEKWTAAGFTQAMKTPDDTLIYVAPDQARQIKRDQVDCMGCLSFCKFSNWSDRDDHTTGKPPDPRSFCIQKTLQDIAHYGDVANQLMFAGHNVYKCKQDPFYSNGFVPTVRELVDRIVTGR